MIEKIFKRYLIGVSEKPLSMRKQLSRIITFCCVMAVCVQTVVMAVMLSSQYVQRERENTLFLLESSNGEIEAMFQNLGEMVLSIQHSVGLRNFFGEGDYSIDDVSEELKSVANLFSERNRRTSFEPFVEKIYLFNREGRTVSNLYYPMTIPKIQESQEYYESLYEEYKKSEQEFYAKEDEECINLCVQIYDPKMEVIGACIFALNNDFFEANYESLEKLEYYNWSLKQGGEILLGRDTDLTAKNHAVLENGISIGFGLEVYAAVEEWVVYQPIGMTVAIVLGIALLFIAMLSIVAHRMAIYYVQPLENVAEKIKLVGSGNFDTKLEDSSYEELQNITATFNDMTDYIESLIKEVYETQLVAQQSQIQYLQSQMNPHFLFNILSMIEMRAALNHDTEVQELVYKLSRLYQGKIFRKDEYFIYLEEEMEIVDFYLSLQNKRFGEKITYSIFYEGDKSLYKEMTVPRLSIEPLVENAVCHGLEPKDEKGHILINISVKQDVLEIVVEDNGVGFEPERLEESQDDKNHSHVGLWNTNKMIRNLCGEQFGLEINSLAGQGSIVKVILPIRKGESYVEGNDR